jgi:hypothetical protein
MRAGSALLTSPLVHFALALIFSCRHAPSLPSPLIQRNTVICELNFATRILSMKLNRRRLVVLLEESVHFYSIGNMKCISIISTLPNPQGEGGRHVGMWAWVLAPSLPDLTDTQTHTCVCADSTPQAFAPCLPRRSSAGTPSPRARVTRSSTMPRRAFMTRSSLRTSRPSPPWPLGIGGICWPRPRIG